MNQSRFDKNDNLWFALVLIWLIIEYGRPMDIIPGLGVFRPGMIVSILLVLSWIVRKNLYLTKGAQTSAFILFILLLIVHIPFATNNYYAFQQAKGVLLYLPFFLSIILYINSFDRLRSFFIIWIMLMVYLAIRGILFKGNAASSFMKDENDFSLFMVMMIPFCYFLFMYEKTLIKRMFFLISILIAILSIVTSFSRGGFVGLLAVLFTTWLFSPKKILALLLVGILAFSISYFADESYSDRITSIKITDEGTVKERIDSWMAAWNMFKDNPLGVGGNNFPVRFPEYQPKSIQRGMWGRAAHSLWFTLIAELGLPGIVIYFMLLKYNLKNINWLRKLRGSNDNQIRYAYYLSLAFIPSFVGYFASGTFISVLYYPHYFYLTAIIVSIKKITENKLAGADSVRSFL